MPLYTGVTGKISVKKGAGVAVELVHMSDWNVDLNKEILAVANLGQSYKEKVPGIKDWSASFSGSADFATSSGQKTLMDAYEDGSALEGSFYLDSTTFLKGTCYVESLSIKHAADGKADIDISVAGSGGTTLTLPA